MSSRVSSHLVSGPEPIQYFAWSRARLSDGVLHLGDDLNSAHTGTGDVYHRLEPDVSETGGVSDELKLFRRLDGPQLRHDVVATHEVFAPLGAQVFVEGDGHVVDACDANALVEYLILAHNRHRLLGEGARRSSAAHGLGVHRHRVGVDGLDHAHVLDGGDLLDLLQHVGKAGEHEDGVTLDRHHDGGVDDAVMVGPAGQIGDVGGLTPFVLGRWGVDEQRAEVVCFEPRADSLYAGLYHAHVC